MKDPWSHVPLGVDYRNAWKWEPKMVAEARIQAKGRIGQREIKRFIEIPFVKVLEWLASKAPERHTISGPPDHIPLTEKPFTECGLVARLDGVLVVCIRKTGHSVNLRYGHTNGLEEWSLDAANLIQHPYKHPTQETPHD